MLTIIQFHWVENFGGVGWANGLAGHYTSYNGRGKTDVVKCTKSLAYTTGSQTMVGRGGITGGVRGDGGNVVFLFLLLGPSL